MKYRFNEFVLNTDSFELSQNGAPVHIEPQVVELLALLVENHGRMVSKEEINDKIWNGRIVSEAALSSRIKSARQALGDDGKTQQMIRTVHKKGFRFVAEVAALDDVQSASQPQAQTIQYYSKPDRPSVAVLPFTNLSSDTEQEYFSDGITADIITHLSKHRWLNVTARNTSFGYKGKAVNIQQLGRELEVDYVVEGSVQRAGNRVRVSAHLIDAHSGHHAWAEKFDGDLSDIFTLQDEITAKVAARVEPEIGFAERKRIVHSRPSNLEAWDCYHLGIYHFFKFTGADNLEAQRLLQHSHELDPNFGEAYAWWAYAVILGMVYWDTAPTQALLDAALAACDKALSFDSQNASFHALKGRVLLARCEYDSAITENEMAISLNPSFAAAHCGLGDSLAYEGRYDDAIEKFELAIELSPNDPQLWAFYTYGALALLFKHEFETALQWTERAASIPNCQYWTTAHRAVACAYLDRNDDAKRTVQKLLHENPAFTQSFAREKLFYLKDKNQVALYIQGLEMAGVPQT